VKGISRLIISILIISGIFALSGLRESIAAKQLRGLKSCRDLGGYLCRRGQCAVGWLASYDMYCCPYECNVCAPSVELACFTDEKCKSAVCSSETDFACSLQDVFPCADNGICEPEELSYPVSWEDPASLCSLDEVNYSVASIESLDCPNTCSDANMETEDYFNFTSQTCWHVNCTGAPVSSKVLVKMEAFDFSDGILGSLISVDNMGEAEIFLEGGCNRALSNECRNVCKEWSFIPGVTTPFNHASVEPGQKVSGLIQVFETGYLEGCNATTFSIGIKLNGREISTTLTRP
jgi:hypothetical protein